MTPTSSDDPEELSAALDVLLGFLGDEPLTRRISELEYGLVGMQAGEITEVLQNSKIDVRLFQSALLARRHFGRLNDLIHAVAIVLALPHLLEPDEKLLRPSLAAGNDPSRPFDLETDRRVAEFKLSRWQGTDAMRKRQVFKDLVHLTADDSGRTPELYVLGQPPIRFLRNTKSKVSWGLDRAPRERALFEERFGPLIGRSQRSPLRREAVCASSTSRSRFQPSSATLLKPTSFRIPTAKPELRPEPEKSERTQHRLGWLPQPPLAALPVSRKEKRCRNQAEPSGVHHVSLLLSPRWRF